MSFGNTTETDINLFIFNGTVPAWNSNTNLFLALHTADPGEAGTQQTNEATYVGYARVTVPRTSGGFTVAANTAITAALSQFPQCTGGTNTITHVSIGTALTGAGQIIVKGNLSSPLAVSNGIQPQIPASSLSFALD